MQPSDYAMNYMKLISEMANDERQLQILTDKLKRAQLDREKAEEQLLKLVDETCVSRIFTFPGRKAILIENTVKGKTIQILETVECK